MTDVSARLYCAGMGDRLRFCTAETKAVASEVLGAMARKPTSDELREYWTSTGLAVLTPQAAADQIGVSRQTIWAWRRRMESLRD